jgi:hypothetical protein
MILSTKEAECFPELNLPHLKEIVKNRAAKRFKGLPLEKVTLYRYSGQYPEKFQTTLLYVIVFDLAAAWQELSQEQLEQCRDLDIETGWMGTRRDEYAFSIWGLDGAFKSVYKLPTEDYLREWRLFLRLYPCQEPFPDEYVSLGFHGETPKGIMSYEPHVTLYEGFFPTLRLDILGDYAEGWLKKYPEAPITRISLHKYASPLECAIANDVGKEFKPSPHKYALVFEVDAENKATEMGKKELMEYDRRKISWEPSLEPYESLLDATEPNSRTPYEERYQEFIGEDFKQVYDFSVGDMDIHRKDWVFCVKFTNSELNANIKVDGPCVVLWRQQEVIVSESVNFPSFDQSRSDRASVEATIKNEEVKTLPQTDDSYILRFSGNAWEIVFNGKRLSPIIIDGKLKLTGLKYIHYLLSRYIDNDFEAYEPISALNLENAVEGVHPEAISQNQTRRIHDESNNVPKIYDDSVFKEKGRLIEARQDLLTELREAEENNDPGRLENARNELERFNASIKKEYPHLFRRMDGKDPKDSEVKDQHEKARKRVGDKINRALAKLETFDKELYCHLKDYIKKDKSALTYKPAKKIHWKI